jgi:hypothetical protein
MKKSSLKLILYIIFGIGIASTGLLFNKISVVRNACLLATVIFAIIVYFDKKYRSKYVPYISDWVMVGIIVLLLLLFVYSLLFI